MEKNCENNEHELTLYSEEYITDEEIRIDLKCDLCKTKFSGVVKRI